MLYDDTIEWNGTQTPSKHVMYNSDGTTKYTVTYDTAPTSISGSEISFKARLITAQEIAEITGADKEDSLNWNEKLVTSNMYYLDGASGTDDKWQTSVVDSTIRSNFYWLFDRTISCINYGCNIMDLSTYGYWTSSASIVDSSAAWTVNYQGYIDTYDIANERYSGVRPVITILK